MSCDPGYTGTLINFVWSVCDLVIYGVLLLAICYFAGLFVGEVMGRFVGLNANVGGVGFAMLFLLLLCSYSETVKNSLQNERLCSGLKFWQNMYIPVVIAMSASQDVVKAVKSGWLAISCGITTHCPQSLPYTLRQQDLLSVSILRS